MGVMPSVGPVLANPVTIAQGGTGATTQAGLFAEASVQNAQITGSLAYTCPVENISTATLAALTTTGAVVVNAIGLPAGLTVTKISILTGTTPANGPTHQWAALLDSSLHVLAVSPDGTSAAMAASTLLTYTMGTPFVTTAQGLYYIAFSAGATTTAPTMSGGPALTAGATGLTPVPCGTAGIQLAPPALAAQLNSGTVSANAAGSFAAWIT